jgi:hypothetical protein
MESKSQQSAMTFIPGESYTRDHIHEILGGQKVSYLPQKDGKVVCGWFFNRLQPRGSLRHSGRR